MRELRQVKADMQKRMEEEQEETNHAQRERDAAKLDTKRSEDHLRCLVDDLELQKQVCIVAVCGSVWQCATERISMFCGVLPCVAMLGGVLQRASATPRSSTPNAVKAAFAASLMITICTSRCVLLQHVAVRCSVL